MKKRFEKQGKKTKTERKERKVKKRKGRDIRREIRYKKAKETASSCQTKGGICKKRASVVVKLIKKRGKSQEIRSGVCRC